MCMCGGGHVTEMPEIPTKMRLEEAHEYKATTDPFFLVL